MERNCAVGQCIWSGQGRFCDVLEEASVPFDQKWPLAILYLRGVKELNCLSEVQKNRMQELLITTLQDKVFSQKRFDELQQDIFSVFTSIYQERLREMARETSELAKDMHAMFGKHRQEVSSVAQNVDDDLAKGVEPASLLAGLRDTLKEVVAQMERDATALTSLSHKDSLTGLANRRFFDAFLNDAATAWEERREPVSLILFDIDNFKQFNDTYGHLVGDQVLRTLAVQIQKIIKPLEGKGDRILAARYGGEEFVVLLRGGLAERAAAMGEVIRKAVQKTSLLLRDAENKVVQSGIRVTVSVGVAVMWEGWHGAFQTNLVDFADKALYHAKRGGRNCSMLFVPEGKENYRRISTE